MDKKPESLTDNLSSVGRYVSKEKLGAIRPENGEKKIDVEKLKGKLEDFKKKLIKKFPFTKALVVIPAQASPIFEEDEGLPKDIVESKPTHVVMIMPEEQYKNLNKIKPEVVKLAKESGENLWVHIKTTEVDLWSYGLDSKFEFLDAIAAGFPLLDDGIIGALRAASIHKNLVLKLPLKIILPLRLLQRHSCLLFFHYLLSCLHRKIHLG